MTTLDHSIEARGFAPAAIALALRTIGSCYAMRFYPDFRPIVGIGLFTVEPDGDGWRFEAQARAIRDGDMPDDLLDWLEQHMPADRPIVSWSSWGSAPGDDRRRRTPPAHRRGRRRHGRSLA